MMNQLIQTKNLIIVMCSENYKKRADDFQGGAGYEGQLISNMLQGDMDRLVICLASGTSAESIPFFLKGYEYIDFTDHDKYEHNLHRIVDRAYQFASVSVEPLGPIPGSPLQKQTVVERGKEKDNHIEKKFSISKMNKPPTDLEKSKFLKQQFEEMAKSLEELFEQVKTMRDDFDYVLEKEEGTTIRYIGFLNGHRNTGISLRRNTLYGEFAIAVLYGRQSWIHSDNSANEIINVHINDNDALELLLTMSLQRRKELATPRDIVQYFWDDHLRHDF